MWARGDVSSPSVTLLREIFTYLSIWRAIQYFLSNTGLGGRAHYAELKRLLWRFSPRLVNVNLPSQIIPKFQRLSASRETMSTHSAFFRGYHSPYIPKSTLILGGRSSRDTIVVGVLFSDTDATATAAVACLPLLGQRLVGKHHPRPVCVVEGGRVRVVVLGRPHRCRRRPSPVRRCRAEPEAG